MADTTSCDWCGCSYMYFSFEKNDYELDLCPHCEEIEEAKEFKPTKSFPRGEGLKRDPHRHFKYSRECNPPRKWIASPENFLE
jgi:hypothetical protein